MMFENEKKNWAIFLITLIFGLFREYVEEKNTLARPQYFMCANYVTTKLQNLLRPTCFPVEYLPLT